jgi:hypothetical protein
MNKNKIINIKAALVLLVALAIIISTASFLVMSKETNPSISPYKYGIVRYPENNVGTIEGFLDACASAGVGIEPQGPPENEEAESGNYECDENDIYVEHSLNEYSNFFNDVTFAIAHAEEYKTNQGSAEADSSATSSTIVQGNTRSLSASFASQGGMYGRAEVFEECCDYHSWLQCGAFTSSSTNQYVEIRIPFLVIESGNVVINAIMWAQSSLSEPIEVTGSWRITNTIYEGEYFLDGSGQHYDVQNGPIVPRPYPYLFIASFDTSAYLGVWTDCERCDPCTVEDTGVMNDSFTVNIAFLR